MSAGYLHLPFDPEGIGVYQEKGVCSGILSVNDPFYRKLHFRVFIFDLVIHRDAPLLLTADLGTSQVSLEVLDDEFDSYDHQAEEKAYIQHSGKLYVKLQDTSSLLAYGVGSDLVEVLDLFFFRKLDIVVVKLRVVYVGGLSPLRMVDEMNISLDIADGNVMKEKRRNARIVQSLNSFVKVLKDSPDHQAVEDFHKD
jgi:hypothetical protein